MTDSRHSPGPGKPTQAESAAHLDLSRMRHELRTPINHILGYCEMLMEEEQFPKAHAEDLRRIHTGGRELQVLIARYFDEEQFFQQRDLHQLYHELRTPVNHIIGYSDLLIEQAEDPEMRGAVPRSEEHTSELQSPDHLVCRLLLEKKKIKEKNK